MLTFTTRSRVPVCHRHAACRVETDGASVNASVVWWAEQSGQQVGRGVDRAELFVGFF